MHNQTFYQAHITTKDGKAVSSDCYSTAAKAIDEALTALAKLVGMNKLDACKLIKSSDIEQH